jgi:inosose dehydratase
VTVRIGCNPIGWTNDDLHDLGGDTPLEVCLDEARQAGYAGIELGRKFPRRSAELRPIMARHQLALISGWYDGELRHRSVQDEIRALTPHLDLLAEMGSTVLVFAETSDSVQGKREVPVSRRPRLPADGWKRFADAVTEVAEHTRARGVRLAFHHHMGTVVETAGEIDRLMDLCGQAVGLLLDTGHCTYAEADPVAVARRHAGRIVHVHCKDVRPAVLAAARRKDQSFLDAVVDGVFTVPGDGGVDFRSVVRVLKDAGYAGWLVVEAEQDPAKAHPLTYARMGFGHLRTLATEVGW